MITYNYSAKLKIIIGFIINFIYSIFDEIHQMFVPGRTGMVLDVFIDSTGVICGTMLVLIFVKFVGSKRIKNNE